MAVENTRYVTQEVLDYYDSQIKEYIQAKLDALQDEVTKEELEQLQKELNTVENRGLENSRDIAANKDHIDENEADIKDLQAEDKLISKEVAAVSAKTGVLEQSVQALSAKDDDLVRLGVEHERRIDQLSQDLNSKANEVHRHHLSDIVDYKETDLSEYLTEEQTKLLINTAIDAIEFPETDLSDYYTKDETRDYIEEVLNDFATKEDIAVLDTAVSEVAADLEFKADKEDLKDFATKDELQEAIAEIEHPTVDLTGYAKEEYVDNTFATKVELQKAVESIQDIVVPTKVSELENDAGYITAQDIPDTSNFITMEQVEAKNYVEEEQLSDYVTISELASTVDKIIDDMVSSGELTVGSITYGDF